MDTFDATAMYLKDIGNIEFLSQEEEKELFRTISENKGTKKAERARDKLIVAHMPLVNKIAKKFKSKGLERIDLIQEGNIGLIKAVDEFDGSKTERLSSFAYTCITRDILKATQKYDSDSIKTVYDEDHMLELEDTDSTTPEEAYFTTIQEKFLKNKLDNLLKTLDERSATIIKMRYGLDNYKEHTLEEIAGVFNISFQRVGQLIDNNLTKLRTQSEYAS